ncbi:hypothetical protein CHARACLAT_021219 [Characodon lateralis]|uniref:Uncharacterized protein n=1 Tax=Characodon lateralis TaxID=208331 RepID=A0ABU7EL08_9TELE|nr:hypothetical protein [Characodon lateralis]
MGGAILLWLFSIRRRQVVFEPERYSAGIISLLCCATPQGQAFTQAPPTFGAPPPVHLQLLLRALRHLVVFCPYFISTLLMVSLYQDRTTASPMQDDQRTAGDENVTTELHF